MKSIKISVENNIAQITEKPQRIIAGTVGLPVEYTFDSHWDGLVKYAVFAAGKKLMMFEIENTATIPWEVLRKPGQQLMIGVYGEHPDGTEALPTVWANAGVIRHGAVPGTAPGIPSPPPVWESIKNSIGELDELSTEHKETLVGAINEVAEHKEVLIAKYDETTIEEIVDAHNSGKAIVCKHGGLLLPMIQRENNTATFSGIYRGNLHVIVNKNGTWSWTSEEIAMETDIILVVNRTLSGDSWVYDKSYAEIKAADDAGRTVLLNLKNWIYVLDKFGPINPGQKAFYKFYPVITASNHNRVPRDGYVVYEDNTWSEIDTGYEYMSKSKVLDLIQENAPTPNWNASEGEPGYIENRTHFDGLKDFYIGVGFFGDSSDSNFPYKGFVTTSDISYKTLYVKTQFSTEHFSITVVDDPSEIVRGTPTCYAQGPVALGIVKEHDGNSYHYCVYANMDCSSFATCVGDGFIKTLDTKYLPMDDIVHEVADEIASRFTNVAEVGM